MPDPATPAPANAHAHGTANGETNGSTNGSTADAAPQAVVVCPDTEGEDDVVDKGPPVEVIEDDEGVRVCSATACTRAPTDAAQTCSTTTRWTATS